MRERGQIRSESSPLAALRRSCLTLMSERGEANSVKFAQTAVSQYRALGKEGRTAFFDVLAEEFAPDPAGVVAAAQRYAETRSSDSLVDLMRAAEPPRQELLRRLNRAPDGTATLLAMRRELLQEMKSKPRLAAVEADLHHLFVVLVQPAGFCGSSASTGARRRCCSRRSSATRRCTRSGAGPRCGGGSSPTGAASRSSTRRSPTTR